jgi:CMP-N-acetylneuraminic acid synthetase
MFRDKKTLAVVPARSGSRGIRNKNMREIGGVSLIGRAAKVLSQCPWIDAKIITTDSEEFAAEGRRYGLDAPFTRPDDLSSDEAGIIPTLIHAVEASEAHYNTVFDFLLLAEPTSPLRTPEDVERVAARLCDSDAYSVMTVSALDEKSHPLKILEISENRLRHHNIEGRSTVRRQEIPGTFYWINGICYAITRQCLFEKRNFWTENTVAELIDRPVANIDTPLDLEWARFLLERQHQPQDEVCAGS